MWLYVPGSARDLVRFIIGDGGATWREVKVARHRVDVTPDSRNNNSTAYVSENYLHATMLNMRSVSNTVGDL